MAVLSDRLTANGLRVLGGAAILAAILALIAHFAFADAGAGKARAADTTPSPSTSAGDGSGGGTIVGADGGASPGTTGDPGSGSGNGSGTGGGRSTTPPPSGPTIHWYKINSSTKCAAGDATIQVQIAWHVTGADSVSLSVDNPGLVGSYKKGYKLDDAEWLSLDCGLNGPPQAHVWTIYAIVGDKAPKSATINAKATPAAPKPTPSASQPAGGGDTP